MRAVMTRAPILHLGAPVLNHAHFGNRIHLSWRQQNLRKGKGSGGGGGERCVATRWAASRELEQRGT
jgi:hypothetical protein